MVIIWVLLVWLRLFIRWWLVVVWWWRILLIRWGFGLVFGGGRGMLGMKGSW